MASKCSFPPVPIALPILPPVPIPVITIPNILLSFKSPPVACPLD